MINADEALTTMAGQEITFDQVLTFTIVAEDDSRFSMYHAARAIDEVLTFTIIVEPDEDGRSSWMDTISAEDPRLRVRVRASDASIRLTSASVSDDVQGLDVVFTPDDRYYKNLLAAIELLGLLDKANHAEWVLAINMRRTERGMRDWVNRRDFAKAILAGQTDDDFEDWLKREGAAAAD